MNKKMPKVVCILGLSGSGKSSTARKLGEELGFGFFSVGGYQLEVAKKYGFNDVFEFEKAVGTEKGYYGLFPSMIQKMRELVKKNGGVVVDGVYNQRMLNSIHFAFKEQNVKMINLASTRHARIRKLILRGGKDAKWGKKELKRRDRVKLGEGVGKLLKQNRANTVRVHGNLQQTVSTIKRRLR